MARRPDVEGAPYGISVMKQTLQLEFRSICVFLQGEAFVIGVPSTLPRCGGDLLQQEKAFLAFVRGYTLNEVLNFLSISLNVYF